MQAVTHWWSTPKGAFDINCCNNKLKSIIYFYQSRIWLFWLICQQLRILGWTHLHACYFCVSILHEADWGNHPRVEEIKIGRRSSKHLFGQWSDDRPRIEVIDIQETISSTRRSGRFITILHALKWPILEWSSSNHLLVKIIHKWPQSPSFTWLQHYKLLAALINQSLQNVCNHCLLKFQIGLCYLIIYEYSLICA